MKTTLLRPFWGHKPGTFCTVRKLTAPSFGYTHELRLGEGNPSALVDPSKDKGKLYK
jgi:hypothetical protein